ncbi:hypothetical protein [Aliagarivorans taiwanensis]|uniref:hypothetical protein n=1 Tax=Aliagarivorans taiwanensis TaxID=561966 RepID=UPI0012F9546A|nr:hypothetical protein [Aliagarivorans taiwanensis]
MSSKFQLNEFGEVICSVVPAAFVKHICKFNNAAETVQKFPTHLQVGGLVQHIIDNFSPYDFVKQYLS